MKFLNIFRWILVLLILLTSAFYIYLSTGTKSALPYIASKTASPFNLTGDYRSLIKIKDKIIYLTESIHFSKSTLDTFVINQYKYKKDAYTGYGVYDIGNSKRSHDDSVSYFQTIKDAYISDLESKGWKEQKNNPEDYLLKKESEFPYEIGLLTKTKKIAIPLLFTAENTDSVASANKNKPVVELVTPSIVNYILSSKSEIALVAKEGSVQETYPDAKKQHILDADDNEIFHFSPTEINGSVLNESSKSSTTINVKLVNPYYNNFIGDIVMDWSLAKLIGWTLTSMIALFADKIKSNVLNPCVEKMFPFFKRKSA